MSKPEFSVTLRLTPRQAIAVLNAFRIQRGVVEYSERWQSACRGAESRVYGALIDAGWSPAGDDGWHRR